jgi:hypothetical protein
MNNMLKNINCILLQSVMVFLLIAASGCRTDTDRFIDALRANDLEKAQAVLDDNPELVNMRLASGGTVLHAAVYDDNIEMVNFLLKNDADFSIGSTKDNSTPLHETALSGYYEMASILLEHGADVNCRDDMLCTPLHEAAMYSTNDMVELLISHGAEIDVKNEMGRTPLAYACVNRKEDVDSLGIIKTLLEHGADPNADCYDNTSIIQSVVAIGFLYFKKAQLLEDYGAKLEVHTDQGMQIFTVKEFQEICEANREYIQKIEQETQEHIQELHQQIMKEKVSERH